MTAVDDRHEQDSAKDCIEMAERRTKREVVLLRARRALMEAVLTDGPLEGTKLEVEPVEGRPPSTVDVPDAEGQIQRYGLGEWMQEGMSADYSFLYPV